MRRNPDATVRVLDDPALAFQENFEGYEAHHLVLEPDTDTPVPLDAATRLVRVSNWHGSARVLVKFEPIGALNDPDAGRLGRAPTTDVPMTEWYPLVTEVVHLRSAAAAEVTVEAFR